MKPHAVFFFRSLADSRELDTFLGDDGGPYSLLLGNSMRVEYQPGSNMRHHADKRYGFMVQYTAINQR